MIYPLLLLTTETPSFIWAPKSPERDYIPQLPCKSVVTTWLGNRRKVKVKGATSILSLRRWNHSFFTLSFPFLKSGTWPWRWTSFNHENKEYTLEDGKATRWKKPNSMNDCVKESCPARPDPPISGLPQKWKLNNLIYGGFFFSYGILAFTLIQILSTTLGRRN